VSGITVSSKTGATVRLHLAGVSRSSGRHFLAALTAMHAWSVGRASDFGRGMQMMRAAALTEI
jgi:hypothetical protein